MNTSHSRVHSCFRYCWSYASEYTLIKWFWNEVVATKSKVCITVSTFHFIWNFFTMGVSGAATSILGNAGLVKKVPFNHSSLPLASIFKLYVLLGIADVAQALRYRDMGVRFLGVGADMALLTQAAAGLAARFRDSPA